MKVDKQKIAESVLKLMTHGEKSDIAALGEDQLYLLHHTMGRWIRNTYSLWEDPWEPELVDGVDMSPNHPDAISMDIIKLLHEKIKAE